MRIVEIIEKLVGYYKISGDLKFLKIPFIELVEGNGKIRWSTYGFRILSLWPLKCVFGKIKLRRLIKEISDFNYFDLKRDLVKEFEMRKNQKEKTTSDKTISSIAFK